MKSVFTLIILCLLTPAAYAACPPAPTANDNLILRFQPQGTIRTGTLPKSSAATGEDSTEGTLIYDPSTKSFQFCNGTTWQTLGSAASAAIPKAWVAFNGTNGNILSGYNVSSVTRREAGRWTVNFANPMSSTNYAAHITCVNTGNSEGAWTVLDAIGDMPKTINYVRVLNGLVSGAGHLDCPEVYVTVFAN